jgi:hypothetical protein
LADQSYVSVGAIFPSVWYGTVEVFVRLRLLSLVGLLIYLFVGILTLVAPTTTDNPVFREGLDAIKTILILPLEIAIYRLLILGEATPGYNLAISNPRFRRLLGWTLGLWALITLPPYLPGLITPSEEAQALVTIVTMLAVLAFFIRIAILFPAISVGASGASLGNALTDSRGRTWLILKSYLIVLLPTLPGLAIVALRADVAGQSTGWSVIGTVLGSSLELLLTVLMAVVASRLFDWIGHRVKGLSA